MDIEHLVTEAGNASRLAELLGVAHNTVSDWRRIGRIPATRICQVKRAFPGLSDGDLLALVKGQTAQAAE